MKNRLTKLAIFFRPILWPVALIYGFITSVRNKLYDLKILSTYEIPVFSVVIGNLAVGGTGKTPMVSYMINKFAHHQLAVISRGYGRATKGFRSVDENANSMTVGDETLMLYNNHKSQAKFFVSENRKDGVLEALKLYPEIDFILFDDAYQHRKIKASFNILLSTFSKPFFKDYIIPAGNLRESKNGVNRADAIIITKVPHRSELNQYPQLAQIDKPVYATKIEAASPQNPLGKGLENGVKVNVLSALANNRLFAEQVRKDFMVCREYSFLDHHSYSEKDIRNIDFSLPIVTTEKDMVKILPLLDDNQKSQFYVQKIGIEFLENESDFLTSINTAFKRFQEQKGSIING